MSKEPLCLKAALKYAEIGFFVLPIIKGKKQPYIKYAHRREKKPDEKEIRQWWRKWPNANVGMVTGQESGVDTLDIDSTKAMEHLRAVAEIPDTFRYSTGRDGGMQFLFKHRPGLKSIAGVIPDVDIRTNGGITVLPPSIHKSGRQYQWIDINPLEE